MKRIFCVFLTISLLIAAPNVSRLDAVASSADNYEQAYEAIRKVVHQKGSSAELDIPLYIAQSITLDVMNGCDQIESIHKPKISPDQSMVFIGYFLNNEPGKLRIIHLRQAALGANISVKNDTIKNFSEYTYKHYKTRFFFVEEMQDTSQDEVEPKH